MIIQAARVMASETIATLPTSHYANVSAYFFNGTNETAAPPPYDVWVINGIQIYPDVLGPIAYLLFFFIPFGMIWNSHGDIKLLCVLGLITGGFVLAYLPATWVAAAVIIMAVSFTTLVWKLARP